MSRLRFLGSGRRGGGFLGLGGIEEVLERFTKRWMLDEVVSSDGKPTELSYLVKLRKSIPGDTLMTEIRSVVGSKLIACDLELSEALEEQELEAETAKTSG